MYTHDTRHMHTYIHVHVRDRVHVCVHVVYLSFPFGEFTITEGTVRHILHPEDSLLKAVSAGNRIANDAKNNDAFRSYMCMHLINW